MGLQGNLATMNMPGLLPFLDLDMNTGLLMVGRVQITKEIDFDEGLIAGAISSAAAKLFG